jgi:hypothetical protein
MRLPVRRLVLGFAAGAAAGWAAGLLRTPTAAPAGSSAGGALRLPQEDFGEPEPRPDEGREEHPPPRKATAPAVRPIPGSEHTTEVGDAGGASEPAVTAPPDTGVEEAVEPAGIVVPEAEADAIVLPETEAERAPEPKTPKPRRRRTPTTDPTAAAAEALRAGHAEATEKLTTAADSAPTTRRRRKPPAGE